MAAQARGVLSSTPSGCQPFHFPLFLPRNICSGVIPYCLAVFFFEYIIGGSIPTCACFHSENFFVTFV